MENMTSQHAARFALSLGVGVLLLQSYATAAPQSASDGPSIKVTSCTVRSTRQTNGSYDCSAEAAKDCNSLPQCKLQIGHNLTAGKDIDPEARYEQMLVEVTYYCGAASPRLRQRGPYQQSDHANLILDCS